MIIRILASAALLAALLPATAMAASAAAGDKVTPVFSHAIPNIPGKSLESVVVHYKAGGKSSSHTHAKSAFIFAYVLSGAIRSQVNDQPAKVYKAGESFYEAPGAHHRISENASKTAPATLLAVFVVDSNDQPLTTPDKE